MKPKVIVYKKVDKKVLEFIENFCDIVYFEKLDSHNSPLFLKELKAKLNKPRFFNGEVLLF